jgi:RNA polymerase sigma-70 factor (ECF subfamily)
MEGFAYEEIAVITSVEIGTVKSRIHRGRVAVRNVLIARGWRGPDG